MKKELFLREGPSSAPEVGGADNGSHEARYHNPNNLRKVWPSDLKSGLSGKTLGSSAHLYEAKF